MGNLFDSTQYRTQEPTIEEYDHPIIAGDYLAWKREDLNSDYSNSAYTLSYQARQAGNGTMLLPLPLLLLVQTI